MVRFGVTLALFGLGLGLALGLGLVFILLRTLSLYCHVDRAWMLFVSESHNEAFKQDLGKILSPNLPRIFLINDLPDSVDMTSQK